MEKTAPESAPKKRGRPVKVDVQKQVVETIREIIVEKEIIKEVPVKQLSDFDLYYALKQVGFPQGGIGEFMESPLTDEKVYLPHASEIYTQFAQDPAGWNVIRDYLARAFLEVKQR